MFSSVAQSCPALCDPMNCSMPGLLSITNSQSLPKPMPIESVMPSSHLILCHPLLLLPPNPFQHQGLFQWVNSYTWGGQSIGVSASAQSFQWTSSWHVNLWEKCWKWEHWKPFPSNFPLKCQWVGDSMCHKTWEMSTFQNLGNVSMNSHIVGQD